MMNIRKGKIKDFGKLDQEWAWARDVWQRKVQKESIKNIQEGVQEFWVIEDGEEMLGEIHIYWNKRGNPNEANGENRAYLSTFRIHPEYRGQGLGTKLMQAVLRRIKDKGFKEVTIGAYAHEENIQKLYKKWGFTTFVKEEWEEAPEHKEKYFLYLQSL